MPRDRRYADSMYRAALRTAREDPTHAERQTASLTSHLQSLAHASFTFPNPCSRGRAGWAYHNLAAFLLARGRAYTAAPRPKGLRKMTNKLCYRNAFYVALDDPTLTYTEGYALSFQGIPMEHAWCVTPEGVVIDPTWYDPDLAAYFGVEIPLNVAGNLTVRQRVYGILVNDWRNDNAILRSGRIELPDREEVRAG